MQLLTGCDLEGAFDLLLSLLRKIRDEARLDAALQDVQLAELLLVLTFVITEQHKAVGHRSDAVTDRALALFCMLAELVMLSDALLSTQGHVSGHDEVRIETLGAVPEGLGDLVEPGDFRLVGAHHQAEHLNDTRKAVDGLKDATKEVVGVPHLLLVFPLEDPVRFDQLSQLTHHLLELFRCEDESIIDYVFEVFLLLAGSFKIL